MSLLGFRFQPVKNAVFHDGLQRHLGQKAIQQLVVAVLDLNIQKETILKSELLDKKVILDIGQLVPQGNNIFLAADAVAKKQRQRVGHPCNALAVPQDCLAADTFQCVVQKMWIDLVLQCIYFRLAAGYRRRVCFPLGNLPFFQGVCQFPAQGVQHFFAALSAQGVHIRRTVCILHCQIPKARPSRRHGAPPDSPAAHHGKQNKQAACSSTNDGRILVFHNRIPAFNNKASDIRWASSPRTWQTAG